MGDTHATPALQTGEKAGSDPAVKTSARPAVGNHAFGVFLQTRLKVGAANDHYEREADELAEKATGGGGCCACQRKESITPLVQRQASNEEEEDVQRQAAADKDEEEVDEDVQRQEMDDDEDMDEEPDPEEQEEEAEEAVQTKAAGAPKPSAPTRAALRGGQGGAPLPDGARSSMEQSLGHDFSGVRVHTSAESHRMNRELNAVAFTHRNNIYFGEGRYSPDASDGQKLLAHELVHTVQQGASGELVQRKPPYCPAVDPKTLSDEKKKELRDQIKSAASVHIAKRKEAVAARKLPSDMTADEKKKIDQVRLLINQSLQGIEKVQDPTEKRARRQLLEASRGLLSDNLFIVSLLQGALTALNKNVQALGNPATKVDIPSLETAASAYQQGGEAALEYVFRQIVFQECDIDPADLKTGDDPPPPSHDPETTGVKDLNASPEDLDRLNAFLTGVKSTDAPADATELPRVMAALKDMSPEDQKEFQESFADTREAPDPEKATSLADALEAFKKLTPVQRETLKANRDLTRTSEHKTSTMPLDVKLALDTGVTSTKNVTENTRKLNESLAKIHNMVSDPAEKAEWSPLPADFAPFFAELMMFEGLLAGASQRSPEVRDNAKALMQQFRALRDRLETEIAWLAGELGVMIGITVLSSGSSTWLTGARAAMILARLKQAKDLYDKIMKVYGVYTRVKDIITRVVDSYAAFQQFLTTFETVRASIDRMSRQLEDLEAADNTDELIEEQMETLLAELETKLESEAMGNLLETFYIPDDTGPEELFRIFLDIPRGLEKLQETMTFYDKNKGGEDPDFVEILALKATGAGSFLFPLVGYLAAVAADELQQISPDIPVTQRVQNFLLRIGKKPGDPKRKTEKDRNLGFFRRFLPKTHEYDKGALEGKLNDGAAFLKTEMAKEEDGGHWAFPWFKYVARQKVKDLRKHAQAQNWKVRGRPKKPKGAPWEELPVPRFSLKFPLLSKFGFTPGRNLKVELKLNPSTPITVDELDYKDFAGSGIAYDDAKPKRKTALWKWLHANDYELTHPLTDTSAEHIRLEKGKVAPGFLKIEAKRLSQLKTPETSVIDTFIGKPIAQSSDLPEGYHLEERGFVDRKRGLRLTIPKLYLDKDGKLTKDEKAQARKAEELRKNEATVDSEDFNYDKSVEAMFNVKGEIKPGYKSQDRAKSSWSALVNAQEGLRKRPVKVEGNLGYTVNARMSGDQLGSRHLPELRDGDDKGHLTARRFGGTDDYINLIPMQTLVNRWPGRWYKTEGEMAGLYKDRNPNSFARIELRIEYPSRNTRRPSAFRGKWTEVIGTQAGKTHPISVTN